MPTNFDPWVDCDPTNRVNLDKPYNNHVTGTGSHGDDFVNLNLPGSPDNYDLGEGDDKALGDGSNNRLDGEEGCDYIDGETGNDTLLGGEESDTVFGGKGDDHIFGDDADGNYSYADGDRGDYLYGELGDDCMDGGEGDDDGEGV